MAAGIWVNRDLPFDDPVNVAGREEAERVTTAQHISQDSWPGCTFANQNACRAQWEATNTPTGQSLSYDAARSIAGFQAGVNAGGSVGSSFVGDKSSITFDPVTGRGSGTGTVGTIGDPSGTVGSEAEHTNVAQVILESFPWMKELMGVWDVILQGVKDDLPDEIILANVRGTDAYKQRFPAVAARETGGFNPITEFEYLQLEDSYRSLLRSYGVLGVFSSGQGSLDNLFTGWIGGDVSPLEVSTRLDQGYAAMTDAAPTVKQAFQEFYGIAIDDATLLTYFLDEDLGIQEMETVVATSTVGGAALKYGLNITRTRAELLVGEGITGAMAREGFADVARESPQLSKLAKMHRFNPLSQEDLEEFFFHKDPEVARKRRKIFDTALSEFEGAGASSITRRGALTELVDLDQSV